METQQGEQQQEQHYDTSRTMFSNASVVNDSSFMRLRINTKPLINDIKQFLGATEINYTQDENGNYIEVEVQIGKPLANKIGINRIVNMVQMIVNEQTVQGNLKDEEYNNLRADIRQDLTHSIVESRYDWEINSNKTDDIVNSIMNLINPYLTRLIGNKERDSYGQTVQAREVTVPSQGQAPRGLGAMFK